MEAPLEHLSILAALLVFTTLSFLWVVLPDPQIWGQKDAVGGV
jgi:hypothetical protein